MKNLPITLCAALSLAAGCSKELEVVDFSTGTSQKPAFQAEYMPPGVWTQDFETAKKFAAEKNLPILLKFTGSDWCPPCMRMETNVFANAAWVQYAEKNVMLVKVDFPNDKTLVPAQYIERNDELAKKFGIRSFPSFVVLKSDGETELGMVPANGLTPPEKFIEMVKAVIHGP